MIDGVVQRLLEAEIGLDLESVGESSVRAAVAARMAARGLREAADYVRLLESREERTALIDEVVIPETWFFRDRTPFESLAERAAVVVRAGSAESVLRVLSAPCSSGEEPFSVAMALLDAGIPPHRFRIDGLDISERLLGRARKGTYGSFSFRGGDIAFRDRHFTRVKDADERWQISDTVRGAVTFKRDNLLAPLWPGSDGPYDFIFCRNLLIYLTEEARRQVLDALASVLAPEGRILVGHAEALDNLDARFVAVGERGAFSYALRGRPKEAPPAPPLPASKPPSAAPPANVAGRGRGKAASRRTSIPVAGIAPGPQGDAMAAVAAFGAAAKGVAPPARRAVASPANPLERAAELADRGELDAAAALCDDRLRAAADDAEAHQLLGLIRQAQGDVAAAELCFSRALYCDPDRAPAMVHLALLLERRGESAGAALLRRRAERRKETN